MRDMRLAEDMVILIRTEIATGNVIWPVTSVRRNFEAAGRAVRPPRRTSISVGYDASRFLRCFRLRSDQFDHSEGHLVSEFCHDHVLRQRRTQRPCRSSLVHM